MKIVASVCTQKGERWPCLTEFSIAVNFIRTVFWTNDRGSFIGLAQTQASRYIASIKSERTVESNRASNKRLIVSDFSSFNAKISQKNLFP